MEHLLFLANNLGADGKLVAKHDLKLPEKTAVAFLGTAVDGQGKRFLATPAGGQQHPRDGGLVEMAGGPLGKQPQGADARLQAAAAAELERFRRNITILFTDIKGSTAYFERYGDAAGLVMVSGCNDRISEIVREHGGKVIKTIGDAYMVAAGVPRPRADHAQALADLALAMQAYVSTHEFNGGRRISFRIGINSGPVVAGVIGRKKFIYDLWGDAVNVASRMESTGASGLIQITRATYERICDEFTCEPRGVLNVKGKGEVEVWNVVARKANGVK